MSSRRRSSSLSRPVFRDDVASPFFDIQPDNGLSALSLAGRDGPPPSMSRSNSFTIPDHPGADPSLRIELTLKQACEIQVQQTRSFVKVRKAGSSSGASNLAPRSGRPAPRRQNTRMIPEDPWKTNDSPFERPDFQQGLRFAGYTSPLDTSRKTIKGRFVHGLEKEEFKAHLDAFLDQKGLKARGSYMVRFQGSTTDSHSPFTHLFVTSLPTDTSTAQVYADSPDVKKPEAATTWTFLPQDNAGESHWACKAKRFWPVRIVFEGPKSTDIIPGTGPDPSAAVDDGDDRRARRRKRRDTFQQELDLDDEAKKREEEELKDNTRQNSIRPGDSSSLKVNTSTKKSSSSRRSRQQQQQQQQPEEQQPVLPIDDDTGGPGSPTILEAVKQLGTSVVSAVQPAMQTGIGQLQNWWQQQNAAPPHGEEYYDDEEERARRERRRRKREKKKQQELEDAKETDEVERMAREEMDLEKEERRRRRADRRRREAEEGF